MLRAADVDGALTQYGHEINAAWDEHLAGYTTSSSVGVVCPGFFGLVLLEFLCFGVE